MPNIGSWNGRWTGADNYYAIVKSFKKKENDKVDQLLKVGYYHYNFGDGWSAGITLNEVQAKEAAKIRKKSNGFCNYNWMVESILENGEIRIT